MRLLSLLLLLSRKMLQSLLLLVATRLLLESIQHIYMFFLLLPFFLGGEGCPMCFGIFVLTSKQCSLPSVFWAFNLSMDKMCLC